MDLSKFKPASLPEQAATVAPLTSLQISNVFQRLQAQLGAKLADLYAGVPHDTVRAEWAAALGGFADAEIMRGLDACRTRAFAPNLGEFLNLCRPALDPEIAWMEASSGMLARSAGDRGDWSHPAVFRTALNFAYELRTKSFKDCKKSWTFALQREFARGWLKDVPDAPAQLEHKPKGPSLPTPEQAAAYAAVLGRPVVSQ